MIFLKNYYKTAIWLIVMLYLLLSPSSSLPKTNIIEIPHLDKVVHFGMFAILSVIFLYDSDRNKRNTASSIVLIIVFSIIFGIVSEIVQHHFIHGRNGNIYDFIADCVGTGIGIVTYFFFRGKLLNIT